MKLITLIVTCVLTSFAAPAGPLQKKHVAAETKWLIHLDLENFLATQIGEFIGKEVLDKKLGKGVRDFQEKLGIDLDWRKIRSLTAYGTDFKSSAQDKGVLLIESGFDLAKSFDQIIEKQGEGGSKKPATLRKVPDAAFPLYAIEEVFGTPVGADLFLLSKSKTQLEKARQVLTGQAANLVSAKNFPAFADTPKGFLVVNVADGFGAATKLPSQVNALKSAEGGQIVAGEKATNIFLNLALNAKDAESATQLQQVVQGLVALATLSQNENKDLQRLAQGIKVSGSERTVTVNLEIPASDVIAKVGDSQKKQSN
jgi:hypothetical protein